MLIKISCKWSCNKLRNVGFFNYKTKTKCNNAAEHKKRAKSSDAEFNNNFKRRHSLGFRLGVTHTWGDVVQLRHLEGLPRAGHVLQDDSLRCNLSNSLLVIVDVTAKPSRIWSGGTKVYHHVFDVLHVSLLHLSNDWMKCGAKFDNCSLHLRWCSRAVCQASPSLLEICLCCCRLGREDLGWPISRNMRLCHTWRAGRPGCSWNRNLPCSSSLECTSHLWKQTFLL